MTGAQNPYEMLDLPMISSPMRLRISFRRVYTQSGASVKGPGT